MDFHSPQSADAVKGLILALNVLEGMNTSRQILFSKDEAAWFTAAKDYADALRGELEDGDEGPGGPPIIKT